MGAVNGTNNAEFIFATLGDDTISAYGGDDTILARAGDDEIKGGGGADAINGGAGSDTAFYSDSTVGVWVSLLTGTGSGGTAQGDTLTSIENLSGSAYDDLLIGDGGQNTLSGSSGNDTLKGGGGTDLLIGGTGNDVLRGGAGTDVLAGGAGNDTITYSDSLAGVSILLDVASALGGDAAGDDISSIENVTGSAYADNLWGDNQANVLQGLDGNDVLGGRDGADSLYGGNGDDSLHGGNGTDALRGGDGDDELWGQDGNDTLRGETGNDLLGGGFGTNTLIGGTGDDVYYIHNATDTVVEYAGEGIDAVYTWVSYALPPGADVETLGTEYYSWNAIDLTGNASGNQLVGNQGDNVLDGGAGVDQMIGRGGNDLYFVDNYDDEVVEIAGQGVDTVYVNINYILAAGADIEILALQDPTGLLPLNLTGNTSGNQIIGNDGNNSLNGGGGTDQLVGRNGNDVYRVDSIDDEVVEFGGQGVDRVVSVDSWTLSEGADVEILEPWDDDGLSAIDLTGNSSGNVVRGNPGNNVLNGGDGDDELTGFGGQDSFRFDTALDAAFNVDVITDFNVADDTILLDDAIFSSSLGLGNISAGELVIGTGALDANDRIIYNNASGALFYDSDGAGGTAAIQFATVSPGLALTSLDFFVV